VDRALRKGSRGLAGGTSLARLLAQQRGARNSRCLPPLTEEQIAGWARSYRERTGRWPARRREEVVEAPVETWCGIDNALRQGTRGLPGGSSLPNLLRQRFGTHCRTLPARLTVAQILAWADAHHARCGRWPHALTGEIEGAPWATWRAVDLALRQGHRGLPGGDSLARLLDEHRRGPRAPG
jgi:hypothetical protein